MHMDESAKAAWRDWVATGPGTGLLRAGRLQCDQPYRTTRQHGSGDWLFLWTIAGEGSVGVPSPTGPDEWSRQSAGDLWIFPEGVPQYYGCADGAQGWDIYYLHCPQKLLPSMWPQASRGQPFGWRVPALHQAALAEVWELMLG